MNKKYYKQSDKKVAVFDMVVGGIGRILKRPWEKIFVHREKITLDKASQEFKRWEGIMRLGGEAHFHQAVIEADKFLDRVLKSCLANPVIGSSQTLGERLKLMQSKMKPGAYEAAWRGHKVRNRVVHDSDYELLSFEAQRALNNFKKAIKSLL